MAAATLSRGRFNPAPIFAFIVFATIAAGVMLGTHALAHSTADKVRNCNSDNIGLRLYNPTTKRTATLCEFSAGQWGRMITEIKDGQTVEVTSFADSGRAAANSIEKAVMNLVKQGYNQLTYIKPGLEDTVLEILAGGM